jgi:hypothetical protein
MAPRTLLVGGIASGICARHTLKSSRRYLRNGHQIANTADSSVRSCHTSKTLLSEMGIWDNSLRLRGSCEPSEGDHSL